MIEEEYVSFETAKLLKEKGFPQDPNICNTAYTPRGKLSNNAKSFAHNFTEFNKLGIKPRTYTMAPTQQMAMRWLREVHKLYVKVCPSVEGYYWTEKWHSYVDELNKRYPFGTFIGTFNSHEEACEAAIKYCPENLI